ncbi:MAG TPA: trigger factor, partial [Candidatus Binatia bacterium]|nr:trigger factor [Candidatus Binatia bacterium]
MTLNIRTEEDEQRQLKVQVEVPEDRVEEQMRQTARKVAREVAVPGFRRGKAPYNILVQRIGREALRSEAVEEMITPIFEEALAEVDVAPYGQPSMDDLQMEPLVLSFTIPLQPVVTLADYRAIRRDVEPVEVGDDAVQEALEHLRTHHQVLEPVNRPIMNGDVVAVSGTGEIVEEDATEVIMDEERVELLMDPDKTFPGTDFVQNLIGMEVGDEGEFSVAFPEEYEEESLAGKEASFTITVLDVKSRYLPELNDDLAKEEGDYETLDDLREALREDLQRQAEQEARDELLDGFVDELAENAEVTFPPAVVEEELDHMVENLKSQATRSGWKWEDYLTLQGETEASLREKWQEQAERRVQRGLLVREIIRRERLTIDKEELDVAVDERLERLGVDTTNEEVIGPMRQFFQEGEGQEMMSN